MRAVFGIFGGILALSLCGCGEPVSSAAGAPEQEPESVRLGYFANVTHAQAVLGVANGTFQEALGAVKLKPLVFNAGPSAVEALFAGELDLAYIGPGPAATAFIRSHGEAVRVIAGAAANGVAIVVRKDAGIAKLEDLKGKLIATPQYGNTQDISARAFIKYTLHDKSKQDGGTTDLQAIANAEQLGLFKQKQLDASWAPEPWAARLVQDGNCVLLEEERNLWPEKRFAITVLVVNKRFLDAHPRTVERLLRAHLKLTSALHVCQAAYIDALNNEFKRLLGKPLDRRVLSVALSHVEFTTDPLQASVQRFSDWSAELGMTSEKVDLKPLFDLTILERLKKQP
jgi:NitT/TauT family transport system substrate-binding protein